MPGQAQVKINGIAKSDIAVGTNCVGARLALRHQALCKEALGQQFAETSAFARSTNDRHVDSE